mmetsp:Transcript_4821/g.7045  ORF Transcript_4821/g.7045 Transcript_4821/m.7045 type:complete len:86 (+) Transcript_4821:379-636(+)
MVISFVDILDYNVEQSAYWFGRYGKSYEDAVLKGGKQEATTLCRQNVDTQENKAKTKQNRNEEEICDQVVCGRWCTVLPLFSRFY